MMDRAASIRVASGRRFRRLCLSHRDRPLWALLWGRAAASRIGSGGMAVMSRVFSQIALPPSLGRRGDLPCRPPTTRPPPLSVPAWANGCQGGHPDV